MVTLNGAASAAPTVLFDITLEYALDVLRDSPSTRNGLDTVNARLSTFREFLSQELGVMVDDAIEVAFLRTVPESIRRAAARVEEPDDSNDCADCGYDPCSCGHDYLYQSHCDDCQEYWNENHDLNECISDGDVSECGVHNEHDGTACNWGSDCSLHTNIHDTADCEWKCYSHQDHSGEECEWTCDKHPEPEPEPEVVDFMPDVNPLSESSTTDAQAFAQILEQAFPESLVESLSTPKFKKVAKYKNPLA